MEAKRSFRNSILLIKQNVSRWVIYDKLASGKINSALLLGCALAEGTAIFGFITALLIIFVG